MISSLLERYANEYLLDDSKKVQLPGSVRTIADALRSIGSDEQLVAGAQVMGMSASFIRDMSLKLLLSAEDYKEFQRMLEPLAEAGELTKEAAEQAIERLANSRGLSVQDTKDLKLVVGITTATIIGALSAKTSLKAKFTVHERVLGQLNDPRMGNLAGKINTTTLQSLVNNPNALRVIDKRSGHINVIQEVDGKLIRITVPNNDMKIISVGPIRSNQVKNLMDKGDFIQLK